MSNKPALKLRDGRINLVVWKNETKDGKAYYTTVLTRGFKDGDDWRGARTRNRQNSTQFELS
jgi:hypothetical protein